MHAGRPATLVPALRLFDYVRNCLRKDYGIGDQQYRSNQELDHYLNECLKIFATMI